MVKYWSDRVKFWIYAAFRAFRTSHQLLSLAVVYRSNRGMQVWVKTEDALRVVPVLIFMLYTFLNMLLNFETILTDGKMNNIIILKCPLVPTFLLLIKARRCDPKNGNILSQGPICLGVFCHIFSTCLSTF